MTSFCGFVAYAKYDLYDVTRNGSVQNAKIIDLSSCADKRGTRTRPGHIKAITQKNDTIELFATGELCRNARVGQILCAKVLNGQKNLGVPCELKGIVIREFYFSILLTGLCFFGLIYKIRSY